MDFLCTSDFCSSSKQKYYCQSHCAFICTYCKRSTHDECSLKPLISADSLKDQIFQFKKLIDTLQKDFNDFNLQEYFPEFQETIEKYKDSFVKIRDLTIQTIEDKKVLKLENCKIHLDKIVIDLRKERTIARVMSYLYELNVFNSKGSDTDTITTTSQSTLKNKTCASEENSDKPIKPVITDEETKEIVEIVGSQSISDLRSKYSPKEHPKKHLSDISLNLSQQDDVDFMKEFIKKKKTIDVEKYTFKLPENYDDERITRDFIDTCVNPKACKEIELTNDYIYDLLCFLPYESCISKIMEAGDFRLHLHNFELDESTLQKFATKVENKNIVIDLDDCWLKYWDCKKPEKITWHNEKQWKLNSVKYLENRFD
ncbi:unnamed protein product [Moneuplotes crassus]|uniref:Uncharacterized protein n=1 Tax=Euplotes crassus TaxID=5936 RepID=A0AAD1X4E4_EUPCR|nr:unnamed protein product [Moneuplotes crassus]